MAEKTRAQKESERLLGMLKDAGAPVPDGASFQQTYASRSSRVEGGAVWVIGLPGGQVICSQWPRRALLRTGVEAHLSSHTNDWIVTPARWPS